MSGPWTFEVPGPPISKERPRMNRKTGVVYTPERTKRHEATVYYSMKQAGVKLEKGRIYGIEIVFYLSALRIDQDNALKLVLDGMFPRVKGEADDKQIVNTVVSTRYVQDATEERTVVTIEDRGELYQWMKEEEE
jgi:Holliday junction resolvase RusA-like endonuclease